MVLLCLVCDRVACYVVNGNSVCDDEKCLDTAARVSGERIVTHKQWLRNQQKKGLGADALDLAADAGDPA